MNRDSANGRCRRIPASAAAALVLLAAAAAGQRNARASASYGRASRDQEPTELRSLSLSRSIGPLVCEGPKEDRERGGRSCVRANVHVVPLLPLVVRVGLCVRVSLLCASVGDALSSAHQSSAVRANSLHSSLCVQKPCQRPFFANKTNRDIHSNIPPLSLSSILRHLPPLFAKHCAANCSPTK